MSFKQILSILLGQYFPGLFGFQAEDTQQIFPFKKKMLNRILLESGYLHIQATKPDTVGKGSFCFEHCMCLFLQISLYRIRKCTLGFFSYS